MHREGPCITSVLRLLEQARVSLCFENETFVYIMHVVRGKDMFRVCMYMYMYVRIVNIIEIS